MAITFVGAEQSGFWMHDTILELWLRWAALHIDDQCADPALARRIRDQWLLASRGLCRGTVPLDLVADTATGPGRDIVLGAAASLLKSLREGPPVLSRDVINLMGMSGKFMNDVETHRLIEVSESIIGWIGGKAFGGNVDHSFMPGSSPLSPS
jgi:hypothetical protein